MEKYKKLKEVGKDEGESPSPNAVVIGFDEMEQTEKTVRYRKDSNRFFDEPYTGSVYPFDRMNKWREE